HRREDLQPLRRDLAELLAEALAGRPAGERVWPGKWWAKATRVMKADLRDARLASVAAAGGDAQERQAREPGALPTDPDPAGGAAALCHERGGTRRPRAGGAAGLGARQAWPRQTGGAPALKRPPRRPRLADTRAALDALPELPGTDPSRQREVLAATGTDGRA